MQPTLTGGLFVAYRKGDMIHPCELDGLLMGYG
jgi:hypothetical protein